MSLTPPRTAAVVIMSILAVGLFGCSPAAETLPSPTPSVTETATPSPTPTPTPTPTPETAMSPLTGKIVLESAITGPSLAAKIDNHWDARPQWGLEHTDLVYEELVEGGLTRYVAVWFSDVPKEIGPIRSIRPMDPDIISPLGGIVAYSGGKPEFVQMMRNTPVHNSIHGGKDDKYMFRSNAKTAPHNVVVEAQRLRAAYSTIDPPKQQFRYSLLPATASAAAYGKASEGVDMTFAPSSPRAWRWHAASGTYLRSQDSRKDLDSNGDRLRATNVVVMRVAIDWSYGIVPRTVMVDSGKASVFTGGKVLPVTWSKKNRDAPIVLKNANGVEVHLAAGNTWIELVPESGSVKVVY